MAKIRKSDRNDDAACLVGLSGIDASGKGYVARPFADQLTAAGRRVALINVDGWLNLPNVRFAASGSDQTAGHHFYHHALRLEEMFSRLIMPLRRDRSITLTMDHADETSDEFRQHTYDFSDIDLILLEGIFIFRREFAHLFDLKIWIECDFDIALERAIARGQEGLSRHSTIAAYETIYFPAQRLHFALDRPRDAADILLLNNDPLFFAS